MTSRRAPLTVRELVVLALIAAAMIVGQVAFASLPNVEIVSLIVILTTLRFGPKALFSIYVFVLLEGVVWGFGTWWFCYLYIWTVLWGVVTLFRACDSPFVFAFISALFGLFFGALCSFVYLFIGGPGAAISFFVAGVGFDLVHCVSNFIVALVLFVPLRALFKRI